MLSKKGQLYQSPNFLTLHTLANELLSRGFTLTRGHQKDSPSGGRLNTTQTMLVFERPEVIQYDEEQTTNNVATTFNDEERAEVLEMLAVFEGKVMIFGNDPIERVRVQHLYMKCGPLRSVRGSSPAFAPTAIEDHFVEVDMVRVSLNTPPELVQAIPTWLQYRSRKERDEAKAKIDSSVSSF